MGKRFCSPSPHLLVSPSPHLKTRDLNTMSGFFYFLPITHQQLVTGGRLARGRLKAYGLDDVLADVVDVPEHCIATPVSAGPDDRPGTLLFPLTPGVPVPLVPGYMPESQTWTQAGNHWIGYEGDEPPRPEHFARAKQVPGYLVPDAHGRSWSIPLIRGLDRPYGALPCDYQFGPDFLPAEVLRSSYRDLWEESAKMWDAYEEESGGVPDAAAAQFAARCLAINYRLGPAELNLLAECGQTVLDRGNVFQFVGGAIDAPAVVEFMRQKKTTPSLPTPAGTASRPGMPGATNTGDQPAASSE